MSWRENLPARKEWLTLAEWAEEIGESRNWANVAASSGRVSVRTLPAPPGMPGRWKTVRMVRSGTPRPPDWRETLPPVDQWMTIAEWSIEIGESRQYASTLVSNGRVPFKTFPLSLGRWKQIRMVRPGTKPPPRMRVDPPDPSRKTSMDEDERGRDEWCHDLEVAIANVRSGRQSKRRSARRCLRRSICDCHGVRGALRLLRIGMDDWDSIVNTDPSEKVLDRMLLVAQRLLDQRGLEELPPITINNLVHHQREWTT